MATARRARPLAAGLLLAGLASVVTAFGADTAPVVVGPLALGDDALRARLAGLSPLELRQYGATGPQARLAFVERVVVPELLLEAEAGRLGLASDPHVRARLRDALFQVLVARERGALPAPSDEEIARYHAAHRGEFARPERIRLWRILVQSEAEARELVSRVRGAGGPERWRALAREKSLDPATKERGGDLGFVRPDGSTDVPELRVDRALFDAARPLENGELTVVAEGERYAALWRRGSLAPAEVPLATARPTIERRLTEQKLAARLDALAAELAKKHVSKRKDALLELVHMPAFPPR